MASATGGRRRLPATERRAGIVDAAGAVFGRRGFGSASVGAIARAAGVNVSVLYDHFPSKEALHAAVIAEHGERLIAHQRERIASTPPGRARLRAAHDSLFEWAEENPEIARVVFRDAAGPPEVVEHQRAFAVRATRAIAGYLLGTPTRDADPHPPADVVVVAEFLRGGTNALATWWLDHPERIDRQHLVDRLTDLTWAGLAALGEGGALAQ